jgi:hypothetical protein
VRDDPAWSGEPPADDPKELLGVLLGAEAPDPDLVALVAAWPTLAPELRSAILRVAGIAPAGGEGVAR